MSKQYICHIMWREDGRLEDEKYSFSASSKAHAKEIAKAKANGRRVAGLYEQKGA